MKVSGVNRDILRAAFVFILAVFIIAGCSDDDSGSSPVVELSNSVWVDQITGFSGQTAVRVGVYFANTTPIASLEVPLRATGFGFSIDSVSFYGSRLDPSILTESVVSDYSGEVLLSALAVQDGVAYIDSGQGLLGNIYFTLFSESRGEVIEIDTFSVDDATRHSLLYIDTTGIGEIVPEYFPGEISVLQ